MIFWLFGEWLKTFFTIRIIGHITIQEKSYQNASGHKNMIKQEYEFQILRIHKTSTLFFEKM